MAVTDIRLQERMSVQVMPDAKGNSAGSEFWSFVVSRVLHLPQWGTRERERQLRSLYRHEYFMLAQSAFAGLTKKWSATPWELSSRFRAVQIQDMISRASFGKGWSETFKMFGLDFLRQDGGAYLELIARGSPLRAPLGPILGIAYLDSLQCSPTGDPQYPVIYTDAKGEMHIMHHTRVIHITDAPDGDERNPGYGLCALSRGIAIMFQQLNMLQYIEAKLDDKPPPGHILMQGITQKQREAAYAKFVSEMRADELPPWGRAVFFESLDTDVKPDIKFIPFAQAPENWTYNDYMDVQMKAFALATGIDVQDLWPIGNSRLGGNAQSDVMHEKGEKTTYGDFLVSFERELNQILPSRNSWSFSPRDNARDTANAQAAQMWSQAVLTAGATLSPQEGRQVLASKIGAFKDAMTDGEGKIRRLDDVDVNEPDDAQRLSDNIAPQGAIKPSGAADKAIAATRLDFENAFDDLLSGIRDKAVNRRRAGIILRDLLRQAGDKAFRDGLQAGGVETDLDADDRAVYTDILVRQSLYVTALMDTLYADPGTNVSGKAQMWYDKSVTPFYYAGLASADINGVYEWTLGPTEHCFSCSDMASQKHRLREYVKRGIMPNSDRLICGGFLCACTLKRTSGKSSGAWTKRLKQRML